LALAFTLGACASTDNRYGLPSSTPASFAAAPDHAASLLSEACAPWVVNGEDFVGAVTRLGAEPQSNPFNQRLIIFPRTSYAAPDQPRVHAWRSVTGGRRFCTIAAIDGDLQAVLDSWQAALNDAQAAYPALSDSQPVVLPPSTALQDAQARYFDLGGEVTVIVSSNAERVRVVSNSVNDRLITPATGVILTLSSAPLSETG